MRESPYGVQVRKVPRGDQSLSVTPMTDHQLSPTDHPTTITVRFSVLGAAVEDLSSSGGQKQIRLLEQFHQCCLLSILGIKWQDHVSNGEVLKRASQPSIESILLQV